VNTHTDKTAAAEAFDRAAAARRAGDMKGALSGFLMALALAPSHPAYRREALSVLGLASGYTALPVPILDALRAAATDPTLDLQPLSLVVKNIVVGDRRFADLEKALHGPPDAVEHAIADGAWDWLLGEPLLHAVLARAILIGARLENVLTKLRRHFLLHPSTALLVRHERFLVAAALQVNSTRFPWRVEPDEQAYLAGLKDGAALAQALYRPLRDLSAAAANDLPDVLKAARHAQQEIKQRAANVLGLTPIEDAVSQKVQAQYEQFPYPPWDVIADAKPMAFDAFITAQFPRLAAGTAKPAILSAGCGTGRGAIMLALTFPEASITGLDLSRTSLAYAAMKAEQHNLTNITFGIGDILNVSALNQTFDMIESSGVLHHMRDPSVGLRALAAVLKPGSVMRLALYSERGRSAVIAARDVIAARKIPDSDDGVREARRVLQNLPSGHPARGVIDTPEFFTLDGLHDLIFNVQETRYTPRQLKLLLQGAELTFAGFDIADAAIRTAYARAFPDDPQALDLDNWDQFEQSHASAFSEMYQLWCYKAA
jgi:2-polyprenyl-3-methyl-5-hydroxy-6-metoxy-1,4-benzoquinol methylase